MNQGSTACHRRKRQISETDPEASEFVPLSKRINNLHLNGSSMPSETPSFTSAPLCECSQQPSTSSSVLQCALCNPHLYGVTRQALPLPDLVNIPNEIAMANNQDEEHHHHHHKSPDRRHQQQYNDQHTYSPEMDVNTNPHYYTPNKLLFDMHIERVKRHGLLFKPNKYDG